MPKPPPITGHKGIDRALVKLGKKEGKKIVRKAARAATAVIQKQAKKNAPSATGLMKKETKTRAVKKKKKGLIRFHAVILGAQFHALDRAIGRKRKGKRSTAFYPGPVQYRKGTAGSGFMSDAYSAKRTEAEQRFRRVLRMELAKRGKWIGLPFI